MMHDGVVFFSFLKGQDNTFAECCLACRHPVGRDWVVVWRVTKGNGVGAFVRAREKQVWRRTKKSELVGARGRRRSLVNLEFMACDMRSGSKREVAHGTAKWFFAEVSDADVFLQIEALAPTGVADGALEVSKAHVHSAGVISKVALASKAAAAARLGAGEGALLVVDDADVAGEVVLLAERGGAAENVAGVGALVGTLGVQQELLVGVECGVAVRAPVGGGGLGDG